MHVGSFVLRFVKENYVLFCLRCAIIGEKNTYSRRLVLIVEWRKISSRILGESLCTITYQNRRFVEEEILVGELQ